MADSARPLGVVLVVHAALAPDAAGALPGRLAPAIDCLRQEISASDAASRATDLQLTRTANQLEADYEEGVSLEQLLEANLRRSGSELVALRVPSQGIALHRQISPQLSASVASEFAALDQRLGRLAGQLRRPVAINGLSSRPDRSAGCRMLLVPLHCCHRRVEAFLVYLNPIDAAPYSALHTLVQQAGGAAVARRIEADLDRTTALLNRTGLEEALHRVKGDTGSLILIDLDRLHVINELQGFRTGDELIVQVGRLLTPRLLPQGASAARLFGGCFALLLPGIDPGSAAEVATQIQQSVVALTIAGASRSTAVTVSCGVAEIKSFREPLAEVLVAAEVALKLAKERGRARVEIHMSENTGIIRRHDEVFAAADLREALRTKQVLLYAQKIVSLHDPEAALGFELLLRVRDADGEMRSAKHFIEAAQRYQLLPAIDRYVVDQSIEALMPHRMVLGRQRVEHFRQRLRRVGR